MTYQHTNGYAKRRGGAGRFIALLTVVLLLAAGWTALWFYARSTAWDTISAWRLREAQAGRVQTCAEQTIGGFPFRIEVHCKLASLELRNLTPQLDLRTTDVLVAAQIYQPTLLLAEISGPLTLAEGVGQKPQLIANWTLAQMSARGLPENPQRVSLAVDAPVLERMTANGTEPVARAKRLELHGRMVEGSAGDNPVVEAVLKLDDASVPGLHAAAVLPIDADVTAVLRGLKDYSPRPWAQRFREIQQAGGRIDISNARVSQGETIAVGGGSLGLTAQGHLDGQLRLTVTGLEPFLTAIGVERAPQVDRLASQLDRVLPGLGQVARERASSAIAGGVGFLGEQTTLEGKKAVAVPLRFENGSIFLGPLRIGQSPPLF